jgi:hypothetical protein
MNFTPADVDALVTRLFPPGEQEAAAALLAQYGEAPHEREPLRVRVAMLKLSAGDLGQLADLVGYARRDYRDVLSWAEYPEELRAPTWRMAPDVVARIRGADRAQYVAWLAAHGLAPEP